MCGRFVLTNSAAELAAEFEFGDAPARIRARFNVAPGQDVAVVRVGESGTREIVWQRWGLVPFWAREPAIGNRLINARCETAAEKPAFREALRQRRCIVPATGFYEWSGAAGARRPHYIHPRSGLFAMAGLWERWRDAEGGVLESCTVLTTEANPLVARLHDRMPVLLAHRDYARWLDPSCRDPEVLRSLLCPSPADQMAEREVDPRVNDVSFDDPACIDPPAQLDWLS